MRSNWEMETLFSFPSNESNRNCLSCLVFARTEYGELNEKDLKSVEIYNSFVKTNGASAGDALFIELAVFASTHDATRFAIESKKILPMLTDACKYWCSPIV